MNTEIKILDIFKCITHHHFDFFSHMTLFPNIYLEVEMRDTD